MKLSPRSTTLGFLCAIAMMPLFSSTSSAQYPLSSGTYENSSKVLTMMVATTPEASRVHMASSGTISGGCSGQWVYTFDYSLPPSYKGQLIDYTNGTCNGTITCGENSIHCVGVGPAPSTFTQRDSDHIVVTSKFWEGGSVTLARANVAVSEKLSRVGLLRYRTVARMSDGNRIVIVLGLGRK